MSIPSDIGSLLFFALCEFVEDLHTPLTEASVDGYVYAQLSLSTREMMYSVTVRSYSSARSIIWFLISAGIRTVSVVEVPSLARFGGRPVFGWIASV